MRAPEEAGIPACPLSVSIARSPRHGLSSRQTEAEPRFSVYARVAELADAQDLKSCGPKGPCGFDPRPGQSPQPPSHAGLRLSPVSRNAKPETRDPGGLCPRCARENPTPAHRSQDGRTASSATRRPVPHPQIVSPPSKNILRGENDCSMTPKFVSVSMRSRIVLSAPVK
jgi:hypothetical protein